MSPSHNDLRSRKGSESGFTLIEALTAMLVLSVGMISVANLMAVAASSNAVGNQATAAATAASQELERLQAIPYDQLVVGGDITVDQPGFNRDVDLQGVGIVHVRWQVAALAGQNQTRFIAVRAEGTGALTGARSRAEFTTIRSCTSVALGCPPAP
jgi:competence protein ComGC